MSGKWITGADVMQEYGVLAVEIGNACYNGTLHAFTETLLPILEETKIGKIPQYPPIGVDRFQHIQYGAAVKWDWSNTEYGQGNIEALGAARSQIPNRYDGNNKDLYEAEIKNTALLFMSECYDYICDVQGEIKTVCFLINDFRTWIANEPTYRLNYQIENFESERFKHKINCNVSITDMILRDDEGKINEIYTTLIEEMLFKKVEITAWVYSAGQESPSASETRTEAESPQPLEAEKHIEAWTAVLPKLKGAELAAAKLAIEKWRKKSHEDAYRAAIPDGCAATPKEYVSKKKSTAEEVAKRYNLLMPNWQSET